MITRTQHLDHINIIIILSMCYLMSDMMQETIIVDYRRRHNHIISIYIIKERRM